MSDEIRVGDRFELVVGGGKATDEDRATWMGEGHSENDGMKWDDGTPGNLWTEAYVRASLRLGELRRIPPAKSCYRCEWAASDCTCAEGPLTTRPTPAIAAPTGCSLITRSGLQCDLRAGHKGGCDLEPNAYREGPGGVSDAELEALAAGPWRRRR